MAGLKTDHVPETEGLPLTVTRDNRTLRIALPLVAFGALWLPLCRALAGEWSINEQYTFGWFVPFFAAYLFWLRWKDRPAKCGSRNAECGTGTEEKTGNRIPETGKFILFALVFGGLLLLFPVRLFEVANPDWRPLGWLHATAVVAVTLTVLWWIGGTAWLRHFAFPVAFIFVAVPWISAIETPIVQGLMRIIAAAAAETVSLFGVPAQVEGNIIRLPGGVVGVNEACSGVRSLQTSLMIGLLFGELKRLTIARRLFLVVAAVMIALLANFVRALFLVSIAAEENLAAVRKWHDLAGYAIVLLVCIGVIAIATRLARGKVESKNSKLEGDRGHSTFVPSTFYFLLFIWLVAIEISVESWYRIHERQMQAVPGWTIRWPQNAAGFHDVPIDEGVRGTLRYDEGREAVWNPSLGLRCFLFFFRWKPGGASVVRARAHRPDICLPSAGWEPLGGGVTRSYQMDRHLTLPFRRVDFANGNRAAIAHTFFCLQEDRRTNETRTDLSLPPGTQPDWSLSARWRVVRNGVRNMGQQVIELVLISNEQAPPESADAEFARLLPELIQSGERKVESRD
jgi:exosortase